MKISLWAVGKDHEPFVRMGIEIFTDRLSHYFKTSWQILSLPKSAATSDAALTKKKEGELLTRLLPKDSFLVLLDERGKMLSSEGLAELIQTRANQSKKELIFLIGGAFGVDDVIRERADFTWSLSSLVFPHQLVRLILAEQLYRACTIIKNEKYHHQ